MFNSDYITKADIKENNPNWPDIFDHPEILITYFYMLQLRIKQHINY